MDSTPPTGVRMNRFGACLVCRRRKLRCDATQPECGRCCATGNTCQYQDPACRSRTKVLQDHIKELEAKIEQVEHQLREPSGSSHTSVSSIYCESNLNPILPPQSDPQATSLESTRGDSAHQAIGFLSHLASSISPETNMVSHQGTSAMGLPGGALRRLLSIFMQRKHQIGFELHIGRTVDSFQLGSYEPAVPALYYAMLLLGCHFSTESELKVWEGMFYERTKLEIETNITQAHLNNRSKYNPLHHLQAMVILGQWYYFKSRLLEGHVYITRATRFAVALGLHELDSRIYGRYVDIRQEPSSGGMKRWMPKDPIELGEAINLWWACFIRDFSGTIVNGLPPSILLEEIKTVWPVSLTDFEDRSGSELLNDNHSVGSFLDPKHLDAIADVSQDTVHCLSAKSVMLTHCAGMLDTERLSNSEVTNEWLARFELCDRATKSFTESVRKAYTGRDSEEVAMIALAQTAVDCATIQLHAPLAEYELDIGAQGGSQGLLTDSSLGGYSHMRCMEACRSTALAATYVEGIDASYMHMFFGVSWSCAAGVLAKQIPRLRQGGYTEQIQEMEKQIIIMAKSMDKLLLAFPVLALQAEQLRKLLS
ncbi:unnamed protein product [Rhizoctonia solani]|uniref:Zn(2)-C6 fungal-type domain-containing protein n=1 Tax=Rhizoctonia solani TaxID=456999 RepID=A0A8H3BPA7_9AGAM|nr:unnamed protein product [Rhizoctonia solani]